jgi:4-amino-4-deoxy-L-arabinose transferase-like glycosyltransferase
VGFVRTSASEPLRTTSPRSARTSSPTLIDVVLLTLGTVAIRIPAYVATRHLTFDDGTFSSSALAMRDGDIPFRDIFSSQAPLFLPLVWLGDLLGFRTLDATRTLGMISGVGLVLATYWTARQITDRAGALTAAVLVSATGSILMVTTPVAADGPALAFAMVGLGFTLRHRREPGLGTALGIGLAMGAALSTKTIEVPYLLPVVLVMLWPVGQALRRERRIDGAALLQIAVAGGVAIGVYVLSAIPWGWSDVWDQAVTYRLDASAEKVPVDNFKKIISTTFDRDLIVWIAGAAAVVCAVLARIRPDSDPAAALAESAAVDSDDPPPSDALLLWSLLLANLAWLSLVVFPMFRPHISAMLPPAVLLIGRYRPPVRVLVVGAVLLVPVWLVSQWNIIWPRDYEGIEAEVIAELEALPDGAWGISDEPGFLWRAGMRTTADLVDPSVLRIKQERITEDSLVEQAALPQVCAVLVTAPDRFGSEEWFPDLPERLAAEGYAPVLDDGEDLVLYTRADCNP